MPNVSLTDFASQQAELARRQKMADLLQQQASAPIEIQSYKGIQAPIPWTAVLAKALGQYVADNQDRKLQKESGENAANEGTQASDYIKRNVALTTPGLSQGLPQVPDNLQQSGIIDRLQGMVPQRTRSQVMGDALAGGPPPAQPMSGAVPPQPQMPPPQQAPMPPPAPQGPIDLAQPVTAPPVQAPIQDHARTMEEQQQGWIDASLSGNRYLQKLGPQFYQQNQTRIDRKAELADKTAEAQAAAKADQDRAIAIARNMPGLTEDQRSLAVQSAAAMGSKGLDTIINKLADKGFKEKFSAATPEQLHGYPEGTVGQVGEDGKLVNVYNPSADKNRDAQLQIARQNVAISGAHLNLDRQQFAADQEAKAGGALDAPTLQQMATQAWQGDKSVFQNLGRGQQGAQNLVALRKEIYGQGLAMGKSGKDLAQMNANFVGLTREQGAMGGRAGNANIAAAEVPALVDQSREAYSKLSRTDLVPYNRLKQMVEAGTSSPAQADAYSADFAATVARARALNPQGVPRESDIREGEKQLNTAMGPAAHEAVLSRWIKEAQAVHQATQSALHGKNPADAGTAANPTVSNW